MPLCVDLFCGLGGWAEGFLAENYDVIGFDIERHVYPAVAMDVDAIKLPGNTSSVRWCERPIQRLNNATKFARRTGELAAYPAQLVLQDVRTLHGSQFKHAACIVASPPCQEYSYRAMPWKRAKALPPPSNELWDACFRIQQEASEAAGRYIPMVVENVCGAQRWVGRAKWHYGSYYLWGDVPALMPFAMGRKSQHEPLCETPAGTGRTSWFFGNSKHEGRYYGMDGVKDRDADGYERTHPDAFGWKTPRTSSHSSARRAASAMIAKIPFALARHIAEVYKPDVHGVEKQSLPMATVEPFNRTETVYA